MIVALLFVATAYPIVQLREDETLHMMFSVHVPGSFLASCTTERRSTSIATRSICFAFSAMNCGSSGNAEKRLLPCQERHLGSPLCFFQVLPKLASPKGSLDVDTPLFFRMGFDTSGRNLIVYSVHFI